MWKRVNLPTVRVKEHLYEAKANLKGMQVLETELHLSDLTKEWLDKPCSIRTPHSFSAMYD